MRIKIGLVTTLTIMSFASFRVQAHESAVSIISRDNILLANYCLPVVARKIELTDSYLAKQPPEVRNDQRMLDIAKQPHDDFDRLNLYLSPDNTRGVSKSDQLSALLRGQADNDEIRTLSVAHCPLSGPELKTCNDNLAAQNPVIARVRRCNDLSWIPF